MYHKLSDDRAFEQLSHDLDIVHQVSHHIISYKAISVINPLYFSQNLLHIQLNEVEVEHKQLPISLKADLPQELLLPWDKLW